MLETLSKRMPLMHNVEEAGSRCPNVSTFPKCYQLIFVFGKN